MLLSYAICVCNEAREVGSLISFLLKVKNPDDEINILVDSLHVTSDVRKVLAEFGNSIVIHEREFDGKFATHRNFHIDSCRGEYIFQIDADEMPQEPLILSLNDILSDRKADAIWMPRINIHPGSTKQWIDRYKFNQNELGWINWPDMQCRIFRNSPDIRYSSELHERVEGAKLQGQVPTEPRFALWHIKSIEKQDSRWDSNGNYVLPDKDN